MKRVGSLFWEEVVKCSVIRARQFPANRLDWAYFFAFDGAVSLVF